MTDLVASLLGDLRELVRVSHVAKDDIGDVLALDWTEVDGGIEADRGSQVIRVTRDDVEIRHKTFGGLKVIPLR